MTTNAGHELCVNQRVRAGILAAYGLSMPMDTTPRGFNPCLSG